MTAVPQAAVPPELANVGFSEKMVYLPHSYQANDYNMSDGLCFGGEDLRDCQASVRQAQRKHFLDTRALLGVTLAQLELGFVMPSSMFEFAMKLFFNNVKN